VSQKVHTFSQSQRVAQSFQRNSERSFAGDGPVERVEPLVERGGTMKEIRMVLVRDQSADAHRQRGPGCQTETCSEAKGRGASGLGEVDAGAHHDDLLPGEPILLEHTGDRVGDRGHPVGAGPESTAAKREIHPSGDDEGGFRVPGGEAGQGE
jgi:hypothetical protein